MVSVYCNIVTYLYVICSHQIFCIRQSSVLRKRSRISSGLEEAFLHNQDVHGRTRPVWMEKQGILGHVYSVCLHLLPENIPALLRAIPVSKRPQHSHQQVGIKYLVSIFTFKLYSIRFFKLIVEWLLRIFKRNYEALRFNNVSLTQKDFHLNIGALLCEFCCILM